MRLRILAVGLVLVTGPGQAQEVDQEPSVELPAALARVLTDYEAAWRRGDAAGLPGCSLRMASCSRHASHRSEDAEGSRNTMSEMAVRSCCVRSRTPPRARSAMSSAATDIGRDRMSVRSPSHCRGRQADAG